MQIIEGIPVFGNLESADVLTQAKNCQREAFGVALMADHHLGYGVPIGGVVAYEGKISPSGVGFDIACGNKAIMTDADPKDVRANIKTIMDDIVRVISFGVGRKNEERVEDSLFDDDIAWRIKAIAPLKSMAQQQLGTVGSGNHYVDIFEDEMNRVWVGVHFGSRGLGHKIATHFLKLAGGKDGMMVDPVTIEADSELGAEYLAGMHLAGRYAYAGRDWVCERVAKILGAEVQDEIHNHHNFAWLEEHQGKKLWVVRKGATPAFPGQRGFVGGTMGEDSVILEGVESPDNIHTFSSTVHGAGRVLGRREAIGRFRTDANGKKQREPGKVRHDEWMKWISDAGVELRGAGLDEAPQCYKRLYEVLDAHSSSTQIRNVLHPIGVAMAGANEMDPYKD